MVLIDIKISGLELMQLLDFFDTQKYLPQNIQMLNDTLRHQFASGIFSMKVDEFKIENNMGSTEDAIATIKTQDGHESGSSSHEEIEIQTTSKTTTTTTEEPGPTRARSKKDKAAAARKRRRGVQSGPVGIRRLVTLSDQEGEDHESGETAVDGRIQIPTET